MPLLLAGLGSGIGITVVVGNKSDGKVAAVDIDFIVVVVVNAAPVSVSAPVTDEMVVSSRCVVEYVTNS